MIPGRGGSSGVAADWVTEENADEKFGIPPSQVVDYLALVGDSSDNIPGARGVGPKTAVALLQQHGDIEALIANAEGLKPPRASKSLRENAEAVQLSKRLVTIMTDLDVELDLESLKVGEPNNEALRDIFVELEFRSLAEQFAALAQVSGVATAELERAEVTYSVVDELSEVQNLIDVIRAAGRVAIAAEPATEDPLRGELVSVGLSLEGGTAWYLPFAHHLPFELTFEGEGSGEVRNLPSLATSEMAGLKAVLEDPKVAKVGQELKRTALTHSRAGVKRDGRHDGEMGESWCIDRGR